METYYYELDDNSNFGPHSVQGFIKEEPEVIEMLKRNFHNLTIIYKEIKKGKVKVLYSK